MATAKVAWARAKPAIARAIEYRRSAERGPRVNVRKADRDDRRSLFRYGSSWAEERGRVLGGRAAASQQRISLFAE